MNTVTKTKLKLKTKRFPYSGVCSYVKGYCTMMWFVLQMLTDLDDWAILSEEDESDEDGNDKEESGILEWII